MYTHAHMYVLASCCCNKIPEQNQLGKRIILAVSEIPVRGHVVPPLGACDGAEHGGAELLTSWLQEAERGRGGAGCQYSLPRHPPAPRCPQPSPAAYSLPSSQWHHDLGPKLLHISFGGRLRSESCGLVCVPVEGYGRHHTRKKAKWTKKLEHHVFMALDVTVW